MQDRLPNKPGRILITPEDGSAPFYATITRADEPLQEGDALNKANLLKDQTAARYGKGNNAVPDDILAQIATELDRYSFAQASGLKMAYGSYVGDGTHGPANPRSLTFDFEPVLVFVSAFSDVQFLGSFHRGSSSYAVVGASGTLWASFHAVWDGNTLTWHCDTDTYEDVLQFDHENTTYHWVAFGLGNTGLDFDRLDEMALMGNDEEEEENV